MGLQMKIEDRICPVCGESQSATLYRQMFAKLPGLESSFEQCVDACGECGMVYVKSYLSDRDLSYYYSNMSNYEYAENNFEFPESDRKKARQQYEYISRFSNFPYHNVLDIGCSLGFTLSLFKSTGSRVLGFEPSEKNKEIAKEKYGVDVVTRFFDADVEVDERYDLVILSHVAEHLKHPKALLRSVKDAISSNGLVYVEVPCTELFDERDLFQFSFEHINYFSHGSLLNLMHAAGFEEVDHVVFENSDGAAPFYPTLGTLWCEASRDYPLINRYDHDYSVIKSYVDLINKHTAALNKKIDDILSMHKNIAIWGAGTLTAQLLAQTALGSTNVKLIYDNDPKKDAQSLNGVPIKKPTLTENLLDADGLDAIIIGSWSSQNEIYSALIDSIGTMGIYKLF